MGFLVFGQLIFTEVSTELVAVLLRQFTASFWVLHKLLGLLDWICFTAFNSQFQLRCNFIIIEY